MGLLGRARLARHLVAVDLGGGPRAPSGDLGEHGRHLPGARSPRRPDGSARAARRRCAPCGSIVALDQLRGDVHAAVGDGVVGRQHLHGGDGDALADRHGRDRRAGPLRRVRAGGPPTRRGSGDRSCCPRRTCAGTGSRPALPTMRPIVMVPTFDEAVRMSVGVQCSTGWAMSSAKVPSATLIWSGTEMHCGRLDDALLEGGGDGDQLLHRARFVDRSSAPGWLGAATTPLPASSTQAGHGQDLTGPPVHHDGHAALGVGLAAISLAEVLLDLVLQGAVDGENEVRPLRRRLEVLDPPGMGWPSRRVLGHELARGVRPSSLWYWYSRPASPPSSVPTSPRAARPASRRGRTASARSAG